MEEITTEQFEGFHQKSEITKWADLKINKIYTVKDTKMFDTVYGESLVLTLLDDTEVWAPEHMKKKIKDGVFPFYFRALGLKPCKNNKKNRYNAYDIAYPSE